MRSCLLLLALLLLPSAASAEVFGGTVIVMRLPTAKDDGLLVVKRDIVGERAGGEKVRIVRERSFVFARHLAEGKHLPGHDKLYRKRYPAMARNAKLGVHVSIDFKVDAKGRSVIQGMRFLW
jgi:hypothetical protein